MYSDEQGITQNEAIVSLLSANANIGVSTDLADKLTHDNTSLTSENTELRQQTTALQEDVNRLTDELTRANTELADHLTRANITENTANDTILQLETTNRELNERVSMLTQRVNTLETELATGDNIRRKIGEYLWKLLRYSSYQNVKRGGSPLSPMSVIDIILNEYYEHKLVEGSMAIPDYEAREKCKNSCNE
jgi:uncharacterized small protein (DUF1192 family)